jgi:hypothetical protein
MIASLYQSGSAALPGCFNRASPAWFLGKL